MNRKRIAVGGIIGATIFCAVWILRGDFEAPQVPKPASGPSTPVDAAPADASPGPPHPDAPAPVKTTPFQPHKDDEILAPKTEEGATGSVVRIRGRIRLLDESGSELPAGDGTVELIFQLGERASSKGLTVAGGEFSFETGQPVPEFFQPVRATLDGRPVALDEEKLKIGADLTLLLTGRFVQELAVRVVGEGTQRDLAGVSVAEGGDAWVFPGTHPGLDCKLLLSDATSPIRVAARRPGWSEAHSRRVLWFWAPGHAWTHLTVDHRMKGDRYVALPPGGGLDLEVTGYDPSLSARLRVYRPEEGVPVIETEVPSTAPQHVTGLRAGPVRIVVEKGEWYRNPVKCGETKAEVVAGEDRRVLLKLGVVELPSPRTAPVAGTLTLSAAWNLSEVTLRFEAIGTTEELGAKGKSISVPTPPTAGAAAGTYGWDAGLLLAGRWQALVAPVDYRRGIEIPAGGDRQLHLVVPDPADVRVRVTDRANGNELAVESVTWHGALPEGVYGWSSESARRDPDTGLYTFRAPIGKVELSTHPAGYRWTNLQIDVVPGVNLVNLEVARACGVRIKLMDGATELPWDDGWHFNLELVGGSASEGQTWSGCRIEVEQPGTYRLTAPKLPGFKLLKPDSVVLREGEFVDVVLHLERGG